MTNVVEFTGDTRLPGLLSSYRQLLADGYNALINLGHFDESASSMMACTLASAKIAFVCTGDGYNADIFERAAQRINNDWRALDSVIPDLVGKIDAQLAA